jgi:hypothetical protein
MYTTPPVVELSTHKQKSCKTWLFLIKLVKLMKNLHMIKAKTTQKNKNPTKKQPKKTPHEFQG